LPLKDKKVLLINPFLSSKAVVDFKEEM